jgi:hypothetical protein
VCEQEPYLLELVRYIHINPVRARVLNGRADGHVGRKETFMMYRLPSMKPLLTVLAALLLCWSLGAPSAQVAEGRGPFEECANGIDDDGNEGIDEAKCRLSPTSLPISHQGTVTPELWNGSSLTCADFGFQFGFRVDAPFGSATRYYFDPSMNSAATNLTGGAPFDEGNYVDLIFDEEGVLVGWEASLPIEAVFIKGSSEGNLYVYDPEATSDTDLGSPELVNQIASVELCYGYRVGVAKTAQAERTETYEWTIDKSVDGSTLSGFSGDTFSSSYQVDVQRTVLIEETVSGSITIMNPSPVPVTFTVGDVLDGMVIAEVTCASFSLDPHASTTCTYQVANGGLTNTATVTTSSPIVGSASVTVPVIPDPSPTIIGYPTVNITDTSGLSWTASESASFAYTQPFSCPTDPAQYTDGALEIVVPNTATIVETGQSDSVTVTSSCYLPVATTTAAASYQRTYGWTIAKSAVPTSHAGFVGDAFGSTYTVSVVRTATDANFAVSGTISITNPNPVQPLPVSVSDLVGAQLATLDWACAGVFSVPPGATSLCNYTAQFGNVQPPNGSNVATVATPSGSTVVATAAYAFGEPTQVIGYPTVNITDSSGRSWTASGSGSFTYAQPFACSTNPADYTGNMDIDAVPNTATIVETGQSDSVTVTTSCYLPSAITTAAASYQRTYGWTIDKSVSPASHTGFAGDTFQSDYTVSVEKTVLDVGFAVSGTISITNPNPVQPLPVSVSDLVGAQPATLDCGGEFSVPPGATSQCNYTAQFGNVRPPDGTNVVTVGTASSGFALTATAAYVFGEPTQVIGSPTVNITDTNGGSWTVSDTANFTYMQTFECPTDPTQYTDGVFSTRFSNQATIRETGASDDAAVDLACYQAARINVLKLTQGVVDPNRSWSVSVHAGPDGFSTEALGTASTLDDADGVLEPVDSNGQKLDLSFYESYTLCETSVPAGWSLLALVDLDGDGVAETTVVPYNPNEDETVPQDLGNRCIDFGVGTELPLLPGETLSFEFDNQFPGGEPRSSGYWKNWNGCTEGGQAANADRNGGWVEGFWLLEDVLDPEITGGIVWDDILPSGKDIAPFVISTCEMAVAILDQRSLRDGRKQSNDAAYTLTMHLLAAQMNFAAGAETCPEAWDAALTAETLLDDYNFDGTASYLRKGAGRAAALELANTLERYNRGELCSKGP